MHSRNHSCRGKTVTITCTEGVSRALVIQNAMRIRYIILSSVSYLAVPYLSTLSHIRHGFGKNFSVNIKCVYIYIYIFLNLSQMFFIPRKTERDLVTNVYSSSCKFLIIVTRFCKSLIFSTDFRKILKYKIS